MPCLLARALELYGRDAGSRGFSKTTITNTSRNVTRFSRFLGQEDLAQVTAEDLKRFIVALREQKVWDDSPRARDRLLSPTSVNTYVRAIRAFWSWLADQKLIGSDPMASVAAPRLPRTVPRVLSEAEMGRVIEAVDNDPLDKVIIFILFEAGIRLGGLVALDITDVDLEQGHIRVKGKGGRDYTGYITEPGIDAVKAYLEVRKKNGYQGERFLVSPEGKAILPSWVQQRLEEIGQLAGLKQRLSPHKLRHTYATLSLKYGLNMDYLRRTMGHADIETTSKSYINAADQDVARAHRAASPLAHILNKGEGNPPVDKEAASVEQLYTETHHKLRMRELARELADQINTPSLCDMEMLRELPVGFLPGRYFLPFGEVEIDKENQIKVSLHKISPGIAEPFLVNGLYSHLKAFRPGLTGLSGDSGQLGAWKLRAEKYDKSLLEFLKHVTDDVKGYRADISFDDAVQPGLTRWFILTIWKDALCNAGGHSWIHDDWYKPFGRFPGTQLWQLKCGSYIIGLANNTETLATYEKWHRQLRARHAKSDQARRIAAESSKLDGTAREIKQLLHEFSETERLPGRCRLC